MASIPGDGSPGDREVSGVAPTGACQRRVRVLENRPIARDTYQLRVECPEIAQAIRPGQFVMVRPLVGDGVGYDPLLGRPLALYDTALNDSGDPFGFDVVYLVHGRGTRTLSRARVDDWASVWGPLGNGFAEQPGAGPIALVAGGIGQTPFLALAHWYRGAKRYGTSSNQSVGVHPPTPRSGPITLYYGVRSADLFAGLDDFEAAGVELRLITDDGSSGTQGFVTDLLETDLKDGRSFSLCLGCGPTPMLRTLKHLVQRRGLACQISVENPMACGFGACFSCVVPVRQADGRVDLKRSCVEGPIFDAATIEI